MGSNHATVAAAIGRFEQLRYAQQILRHYAEALHGLAGRLAAPFAEAVDLLFACRGSVVVCGIGKAGLIGQKVSATLASTGTPSQFLHPAEAFHGDLGRLQPHDVLLVFSHSGETEEIVRLLPLLGRWQLPIIAVTGHAESTLAAAARVVLHLGELREACWLGLAPSTSTMVMLAVGDALALVVSRMRGFEPEDFARFHPGGRLGLKLSRVDDHMRPLERCRIAPQWHTVRQVLIEQSKPGRRSGAIMLVDADGKLTGIFTDSDLARLFEKRRESALDRPIEEVMTRNPCTAASGARMVEAIQRLGGRRLSELPVVDAQGRPLGMIDITDIVALFPDVAAAASEAPRTCVARPA
jgi:arabinose-5-phosphate isomerase